MKDFIIVDEHTMVWSEEGLSRYVVDGEIVHAGDRAYCTENTFSTLFFGEIGKRYYFGPDVPRETSDD